MSTTSTGRRLTPSQDIITDAFHSTQHSTTFTHSPPVASPPIVPTQSVGRVVIVSIVVSGITVVLIAATLAGIFVALCLKKCNTKMASATKNLKEQAYDYVLTTSGGSITTSSNEAFAMTGDVHISSNPAYGVVNHLQQH